MNEPSKHGRSLVGFYIALGVVAVLVGLGALLWQPLKLRYALHQVRQATSGQRSFRASDQEWIETCVAAACRGDGPAIEAVIDVSGAEGPCMMSRRAAAYRVVRKRPETFFKVLGERQDLRVIQLLEDIANACATARSGTLDRYGQGFASVELMITDLQASARSTVPGVAQVATGTLEFAQSRLAKELAEAEAKAKAEAIGNVVTQIRAALAKCVRMDVAFVNPARHSWSISDRAAVGRVIGIIAGAELVPETDIKWAEDGYLSLYDSTGMRLAEVVLGEEEFLSIQMAGSPKRLYMEYTGPSLRELVQREGGYVRLPSAPSRPPEPKPEQAQQ